MRQVTRLGLIAILLMSCVGCDQISKQFARVHLEPGVSKSYFSDTLRVTRVENPGAFLSLGASLPRQYRVSIFQVAVSLLVLGLIGSAAFLRALTRWQISALTLLAAGGLGNLIDRLAHDGRVTDFLNLGIGNLRTGIFNMADVFGVLGVAVLLLARTPEKVAEDSE